MYEPRKGIFMELHTLVNREALLELRPHLIKPGLKKWIWILTAVLLLAGIAAACVGEYTLLLIAVVGAAVLQVEFYLLRRQQAERSLRRMNEMYGADQVEGKLLLQEQEFKLLNETTHGELSFPYSVLSRLVGTQHYYVLFTKEWQIVVIDRKQFTGETEKEFIRLIQEKAPQLVCRFARGARNS